jgi:uncharacterized FlgJ-related protein
MKLFVLSDDLKLKDVTRSYLRLKNVVILAALLICIGVFTGYSSAPIQEKINNIHTHSSSVDTIFADNDFSRDKFIDILYESNIKYPYIVMAQAIIESGNFTSSIFKHNNNMFGMRKARQRATTAIGEYDGFASYRNWRDCVFDYALYQYSAMSSCTNEDQYYQKLESKYSQDTTYVSALKTTIKNQNLKVLFDE